MAISGLVRPRGPWDATYHLCMQQMQPYGPPVTSRPPKWLWMLPVFSLGLLALVPLITIAAKAKKPKAWWWAGGLSVTWLLGFVLIGSGPDGSDSALGDVGGTLYFGAWIGSVVYSLVMGPKVPWAVKGHYVPLAPPPPPPVDPNAAAVAGVQASRLKRDEARELVRRDPMMARDLLIGRPDLQRQYDDGGLVDVNSAPEQVLAQWLSLTPTQSGRVVEVRQQLGGFEHVDDLVNFAGLEPATFDRVKDRIILL